MIAHRLSTVRHADQILVMKRRADRRARHPRRAAREGRRLPPAPRGADARARKRPARADNGGGERGAKCDESPESAGGGDLAPGDERARLMVSPAQKTRPKIVLLGMMTKMPVAGVVWQNLHYLLGFERLGYEVYYVETHARTPSMLMSRRGRRQLGARRRVHRGDHAPLRPRRPLGVPRAARRRALLRHERAQLERLYGSAELIINLHGGTHAAARARGDGPARLPRDRPGPAPDRARGTASRRRSSSSSRTAPSSPSARTGAARLRPARPGPLPLRADAPAGGARPLAGPLAAARRDVFTTIGNWRQEWRDVTFEGERYTWSKHHEFLKFLDLPRRTWPGASSWR